MEGIILDFTQHYSLEHDDAVILRVPNAYLHSQLIKAFEEYVNEENEKKPYCRWRTHVDRFHWTFINFRFGDVINMLMDNQIDFRIYSAYVCF